jgi:hypothetical protein
MSDALAGKITVVTGAGRERGYEPRPTPIVDLDES